MKYLFVIIKLILIVAVYFLQHEYIVAQSDKLLLNNYQKAAKILQKAIEQHGGQAQFTAPISFQLEGTKYFFGHYDVPEKTVAVIDTEQVTFFPSMELSYLYSAVDYYGKRSKIIMTHQDSAYYFGYFSRDFAKGKLQERTQLYLSFPTQMLLLANNNKKTICFIGEDKEQNVIGFNDDLGNRFNLCIDKKTNRLQKVIQFTYNDVYGDSFDESIYEYPNERSIQPSKYTRREHGLLESSFTYKNFKTNPTIDTAFIQSVCPTCKIDAIEKNHALSIENVAKNLWLLELKHLNNKVLLAEYNTYLILFEAPKDVQTCKEVIDLTKKQFPNKPIKYVAFSHHHPDHAGGFAAFVQNNTQLITTKGNIPYFEKLLTATHTLKPENTISFTKMSSKIISAKDSLNLEDEVNQVIIYEAGENTDHVKEFLFFYFPRQKILFVGDLVMFPQKGISDQYKRAYSVYELIKNKKLDVEKIYTSWPLKEQKPYGTMQDLKASLIKNYPNLQAN